MNRSDAETLIRAEIASLASRGWRALGDLDGPKHVESRVTSSGEAYRIEVESFLDRSDWDEADRHVLVRLRPAAGLRRWWPYRSGFVISNSDEWDSYPQRVI